MWIISNHMSTSNCEGPQSRFISCQLYGLLDITFSGLKSTLDYKPHPTF